MGRYEEALAAFDQAATIWQGTADGEARSDLVVDRGWTLALAGATREGMAYLTPFLESARAHECSPTLIALLTTYAWLQFSMGDYRAYLATSRETSRLAAHSGDEQHKLREAVNLGNALQMLGQIREAIQVNESAMLEERADMLAPLTSLVCNNAAMRSWQGRFRDAQVLADRAVTLADRHGDPVNRSMCRVIRCRIRYLRGTWQEAVDDALHALETSRLAGVASATMYALQELGRLHVAQGNYQEAASELETALGLAEETGDWQAWRWTANTMGDLLIRRGGPEQALALLSRRLDRDDLEEFDVTLLLPTLARAALGTGDLAHAAQTCEAALTRARRENLGTVLAEALHARAALLHRQERWHEAQRGIDEVLTLVNTMPYPYVEAHLLEEQGHAKLARREAAGGLTQLRAAAAIYRTLGAEMDERRLAPSLAGA